MTLKREIVLFGSGTPRTGGSLVSNLLSTRNDFLMTTDLLHFFRFIYKKYSPLNLKNKKLLVSELCLRLKYRFKINLKIEILYNKIRYAKNYVEIFFFIISELKKKVNKSHYGEFANSEWRNIGSFLNLDKRFKAFQLIRDPRAVLVSFKKITFEKNLKYINVLLSWIDSMRYLKKNKKIYSSKRFLVIKFEDIHKNPKKISKKLSSFLNIPFDKNMIDEKLWPKLLKNNIYQVNISSFNKKKIFGFSEKRTSNWKEKILRWELALAQDLTGPYLKEFGYKKIKVNEKDLKEAYNILSKDKKLLKKIRNFKKNKKISSKKLRDPSNPKNWSATNFKKYPNKMFVDTPDFKKYLKDFRNIKETIKTL